jgi:hypothetical protein
MPDCTRTLSFLSPVRTFVVLTVSLATLAVAAASPAPAIADGDPASDVLASQPIFLPQDSGATAKQQAQLGAILAAAQKSGYRIRAAVIATPADLGSVGALWRRPQSYAQFLGQELSFVFKGTLLVVMPGGFGVYDVGRQEIRQSALAGSAPPNGGGLISATLGAIRGLAAASGHPLPVQATAALPGSTSDHAGTWVALAIGAVVIAAAWAASLRAMPPKRLTRTSARAS